MELLRFRRAWPIVLSLFFHRDARRSFISPDVILQKSEARAADSE